MLLLDYNTNKNNRKVTMTNKHMKGVFNWRTRFMFESSQQVKIGHQAKSFKCLALNHSKLNCKMVQKLGATLITFVQDSLKSNKVTPTSQVIGSLRLTYPPADNVPVQAPEQPPEQPPPLSRSTRVSQPPVRYGYSQTT